MTSLYTKHIEAYYNIGPTVIKHSFESLAT